MKKYLVTGGLGFLGSSCVRMLVRKGHQVRILDNFSRGSLRRLTDIEKDVEIVKADIRNADAVKRATKGVDSIFHFAFINGTRHFYERPAQVLEVGVKGMVNVLDAAISRGIGELFLASSSEVYQMPPRIPTDEKVPLLIPDMHNPRFSYAGGKIISELMAIHCGKKFFTRMVIFRPHNVYGPDMGGDHVIPQLILRLSKICRRSKSETVRLPIQGSGNETRAFVFIDDFTRGLEAIMKKGKHLEIYNVGTAEEISIKKVARLVGAYFGKKVNVVPGKPALGSVLRRCPDIAKLRKIGYRPQVSFSQGLELTATWYEAQCYE